MIYVRATCALFSPKVWFQNRRARYFKNKKLSRETTVFNPESIRPPRCPPSPPFAQVPTLSPQCSPPGYTTHKMPLSSQYSDNLDTQSRSPDQTAVGSLYGQNEDMDLLDFSEFCENAHVLHSSLSEWDIPEELEAFLEADCRIAYGGDIKSQSEQSPLSLVQFIHKGKENLEEQESDLSDLTLQDLGDFNLSDMEISEAMIDYLLN